MAIGNNSYFCRLAMSTGPRKADVSGMIKKLDGSLIRPQEDCLEHLRGHFK